MIKNNQTTSNESITLSNIRLQLQNIMPIHKNRVSLTLRNCTSDQWTKVVKAIASMEKLEILLVQQCSIGDILCEELRNMKSLLRLSIKRCGITERGVKYLLSLTQLLELEIDDEKATTEDAYEDIFSRLKNLRQLEMRQPNIRELYLGNSSLTDAQMTVITLNLPGLTNISFAQNQIGDEGVEILAAGLPLLTTFQICGTNVTSKGLLAICRNLKLTTLDMGESRHGDEGAMIVARHLPRLKTLWAYGSQLGQEAIAFFSHNLTYLEEVQCLKNHEIGRGCTFIGRFAKLKILKISTVLYNAGFTGLVGWTTVALAKQLRMLQGLSIGGNNISRQCDTLIQQVLAKGVDFDNR